MENENLNDLIVVKQLPVIEETLKNISTKIAEKVATATALVVNDDTIKEVKTARAELNKMKDELEAKRISVKNMVLKPYDDFEKVYKEYITEPFARADKELKEKISNVENAQKEAKKEKILEYFKEYQKSLNIDFVEFEQVGVNVTLSASEKSLKDQVKNYLDKVARDLEVINTQEYKNEILVEYKNSLDLSSAITGVTTRHQELERIKAKNEVEVQSENTVVPEEKTLITPKEEVLEAPVEEEPEEQLELSFKVIGTRAKLKKLVMFLNDGGYSYEQQ